MDDRNLFVQFQKSKPVLKTRRNLPHWEQFGGTYFVTFRTADALPATLLNSWEKERLLWLARHGHSWTLETVNLYHRLFEGKVQTWLDRNHGACPLRVLENAPIVADALRSFDGVRYILDDFAVLPNHVHVIVKPLAQHRLSAILHSWKSFSALCINRREGRTGRLWMDENFDHLVRTWRSLEQLRRYIGENPSKSGLKSGEFVAGRGTGLVSGEPGGGSVLESGG